MNLLADDRACVNQAPVLLVLLPGAYMTPDEMQEQGLVEAVRSRHLAVDVVVAGAGLEYVVDGSIVQRLHQDVIAPYRERGYRRIWLAGISLGGFVSMAYAMQHPGSIEGIFALAPYLGRRALQQEVAAASSPAQWRVQAQPRSPDDVDHAVWSWLIAPPANAPKLHLAYGTEDRFAAGHQMLAGMLQPNRVQTAPGGHDWPPWVRLWGEWLDRGFLPRQCTP
jgi:pimeloyl-ACP methyl ester carboxylesterase